MKRLILIILSSLISFQSFSQQSDSSFKADIYNIVSDSSSTYYYPKLMKKMDEQPGTLTIDDYYFLYYGQIFQKNYSAIGFGREQPQEFMRLVANRNHKKVIELGQKILKDDPLNLTVLLYTTISMDKKKYRDTINYIDKRYFLVTRAILKTGDGESIKSAIKVVHINDENIIKGIKGFLGGRDMLQYEAKGLYNVWDTEKGKIYFQEFFGK